LGSHLVQRGLKWPWVDLKEQLALSDKGALSVRLLDLIAGHLRLDIGVDEAI
jgi:hypothetical protein